METAATMEMRKLLLLEKNSRLILGIYIKKCEFGIRMRLLCCDP